MISSIIACALFFLIGFLLGYVLGVGPNEPYEEIIHRHERKDKKREGYSHHVPIYTEDSKPKIHVVNPLSPNEVEWKRRNKKPDIIKPE